MSDLEDVSSTTLVTLARTQGVLAAWRQHLDASRQHLVATGEELRLSADELRALFAADPSATLDEVAREIRLGTAAHSAEHAATEQASTSPSTGCVPGVVESDGRPVPCTQAAFANWGLTVSNVPAYTFFPMTVGGVCSIVEWARANGRRVRCAGYRHTWTDFYGETGEVLISMLPQATVTELPAPDPSLNGDDQLQGISLLPSPDGASSATRLCKIGAATTHEQLRRWMVDAPAHEQAWTLPLAAVMAQMTVGGTNATMCHGAGLRHETLSDLVRAIEFVNPLGQVQTVDDPDLLRAAGGALGLLGVVTAVTLELDAMTYAQLAPRKQRTALAVPPPDGYPVPAQIDLRGITPADLTAATLDFESRCANDYYAEWFWFPFQPQCYVNTWNNDGAAANAVDAPGPLSTLGQWVGEYLTGELVQSELFEDLDQVARATLIAAAAMEFLPTDDITVPLIDGLHFRRGVQNMRVLDMEIEIPIPALPDGGPDWSVCQRAWWDAISLVYRLAEQPAGTAPMGLTLEMRIMGGSRAVLAPQRGNAYGTCSIEVLTTLDIDAQEWATFRQQIADLWFAYADGDGVPLNSRPHWAKQWQGLTLRGMPANDYLRDVAYADALPEFWALLAGVAEQGRYTVADLQQRFSNPLIDQVLIPVERSA